MSDRQDTTGAASVAVREVVIVAGGQGTRLRPLTLDTPKPLLPLVGVPFLVGMIHRLQPLGVRRVALVVGPDPAPFALVRHAVADLGIDVEVVPEPTPLDTAGGVRSIVDDLTGSFLVLNGDVLSGADLAELVGRHRSAGALASLSLIEVEDTSTYGVCVLEGDRIVGFVEKPAPGTLPGQRAVNAGAYVLEPDALRRFPPGPLSFERQVFPELAAAEEPLLGVVTQAPWADLGTPTRYLDGHRRVLDGEVVWPSVATGGTVHVDPSARVDPSAQLTAPAWLGSDVVVGPRAVIGPYAVLGAGVDLGEGVQVRDSVLHDRVACATSAVVHGSIVGRDAVVGERARVVGGSVVGAAQRVPAHSTPPPGTRLPDDVPT